VTALLTAYFDETGTHADAKSVGLAGFVATQETWAAIVAKWSARLAEDRIGVFHAYECQNVRGQFEDFIYWTQGRRDLLFADLGQIIAESKVGIIGGFVSQAAWKEVTTDAFRRRFPTPYHVAFESCVQGTVKWSKENADGERAALIFAAQETYESRSRYVIEAYERLDMFASSIVSITFGRPKDLVPLQTADLLAYEINNGIQLDDAARRLRPRANRIFDAHANSMLLFGFNRENLLHFMQSAPIGVLRDFPPFDPAN